MVVLLLVGIAAAAALAQRAPSSLTAEIQLATDMADAARRWLSALAPPQRARAVFPITADERLRWHYIPRPRPGLAFKELTDAQRALAFGLLGTALGRRGLVKASSIMALEDVLRRRENSPERDAGGYFLSVFGEPSTSSTWGFRVEGHHLSLNLTLVDGVRPVEAPAFFGAAPARVDSGVLGDTRVLGREEDLGFRLLASLDDAQRKAAVYQVAAPADILTGPGARLAPLPGLAAARMTPAQRRILDALLDEVTGNLPRELADRERARVAASAPTDLVFTWAGGSAAGQPHYYRVAGPTFVYELDNTQAGANHVHTVWHVRESADGDFGVDLLRQHYAAAHAAPDAPATKKWRAELARPIEPFRIAGNIYYVGATNIASYLIATSQGLILLDTGTREMLPMVQSSIVKLGFDLRDVKILLTGHAHWDHVEGHAAMKRATGAQVMAIAEEAPALRAGKDPTSVDDPDDVGWEPVAVDRVLHDGDDVTLGDVTMHALLTAGHTPGCTSWTTTTRDSGRSYSVVFICIPQAAAGVKLLGNPQQPHIADELARSLRVLKALDPDIYVDGHPEEIFAGKIDRLRAGVQPNPLVDHAGYRKYLADCEADLQHRLQQERSGTPAPKP
ncbi:MAG TPA: subclass B3 metallo-beta-lactamase [Kofleriaceae bacterium]|nr:subclass B3 metallo-beta-lactamase [Kofleriaceae bacterium]